MKQWLFVGSGVLATLIVTIAIAIFAFGGDKTDYQSAEAKQRIAWMETRAATLSGDFSTGFSRVGVRASQISVLSTRFDKKEQRLIILAEVENDVVVTAPRDFRLSLIEGVCPAYRRSGLHAGDFPVTFKLQRQNGEAVRSDTVSRTVCRQVRAFKDRART
ncbi:MAG: hypothetical protein AAFZ91_01210 [Pseudomonadota bacterium]